MAPKFKQNKSRLWRWLLEAVAIFFIIFIILGSTYFVFIQFYKDKIYPGVFVAGINLGGKTPNEAALILNKKIDFLNQNGITFIYENKKTKIYPLLASLEGDLAYQIIEFNPNLTIERAYNYGRKGNFWQKLQAQIQALFSHINFSLNFSLNEPEIKKILHSSFVDQEQRAQDAQLVYTLIAGEPQFQIKKEKLGRAIDYDKGIKRLKFNLGQLNTQNIKLFSQPEKPRIYKYECQGLDKQAQEIIGLAPITLQEPIKSSSSPRQEWEIDRDTLASWLIIKKDKFVRKNPVLGINYDLAREYLQEKIGKDLNQAPVEAKFKVENGRVIEFQASQDGQELNLSATLSKLEFELINNKSKKIEIAISEVKSPIQTADINNLGIKEIIGTGESNFSGSPKNRRHNIRVGAEKLNGLLIQPGEEFSLLKALGDINKEAGYLPELVIKDNRTVPEYGGGLCQIGTTMFRAALASGLPITMRRNHSYRVSYYEPAGTDATIYDPWPDLRFINDTPNYILIQTRIEGDNLYFDFWGTRDGRTAETTDPVIYNIVKPGPTKYIETLDLPPGEKKCTEHAHNGADAYFNYKVVYPDGEVKEKRFKSHYVPWREVCLIGVEKLSSETNSQGTATSTPVKNE